MLSICFQPFPVLETERLLLRAITKADMFQLYKMRTDETTLKYLGKDAAKNTDEILILIDTINNNHQINEGITWAIALKKSPDTLIGTGGFWRLIKEHHRAEIGYMLMPQYFNNGYMSEALAKMIEYAFDTMKLHSIEANINPGNKASEAILLKAGFTKDAYFKENFYYNGNFEDSVIFSLLNNK